MIDVIISTYNRSKMLERAINSVINQTYDDWTLTIVDDGSTDNTSDLVHEYIQKESRINYIKRDRNYGNDTKPKNDGIMDTSGKYISFLDDDCTFRPDHLQSLANVLDKHDDIALAYGDRWIIDDNKKLKPQLGVFSEFEPTILMQRNFIDTSDVLVRRSAIEYVGGFDERYKKYIDWNLWLRLAKAGYRFKRVASVLTDYHLHDGQKSLKVEDSKGHMQPAWDPVDLKIRLTYLENKPSKPKVAIFSITYNRIEYTKKCFESLYATAGYEFDHFVVDNASSDGTVDFLRTGIIKQVIANKDNKGISIASNQALDSIGENYDIIMKVDNDCLFLTDGWLAKMVEIWETNHMLALSCYVQGLKDNPGGAPRIVYGTINDELIGMTRHIGGICHFVSAKAYKDFRWDEDSPLHGVQDLELSHYLLQNGYQMGYMENYFCEHVDGTEGQHKRYPDYFEKRKDEKVMSYAESKAKTNSENNEKA